MKKKIILFTCSLVLFVGMLALDASQKVQFKDRNTNAIKIPIEIFDGVAYVKVLLNDEYEASFLVDTGADSVSAISNELAKTMGVLPLKDKRDKLSARRNHITRLYGTRLSIEGNHFTGFDFISLPLEKLHPYWGRHIDGLLGGNILKDFVLTLDYEKQMMTLEKTSSLSARPGDHHLPMTVMGTTPMVEGHVLHEGENTLNTGRFIVDTGVRLSFFNTPFTQRNDLIRRSPRIITNITGYGIGGLIVETVGRIAYLDLGGIRLKNPVIQLSSAEKGLRASTLFDGIIGADILNRFTVIFDFPGKRLTLRPNKSFKLPFSYDMSGIYFTMDNQQKVPQVRVVNIVDGSPAALAGVQKGDLILEMDGRSVSDFTMPEVKEYFRHQGKQVKLKLERSGKQVNIVFVLSPLV